MTTIACYQCETRPFKKVFVTPVDPFAWLEYYPVCAKCLPEELAAFPEDRVLTSEEVAEWLLTIAPRTADLIYL